MWTWIFISFMSWFELLIQDFDKIGHENPCVLIVWEVLKGKLIIIKEYFTCAWMLSILFTHDLYGRWNWDHIFWTYMRKIGQEKLGVNHGVVQWGSKQVHNVNVNTPPPNLWWHSLLKYTKRTWTWLEITILPHNFIQEESGSKIWYGPSSSHYMKGPRMCVER